MASWLTPNWNAPQNVKAISTMRAGGGSLPPFDGLNLGNHVGDSKLSVQANRQWLEREANLPSKPIWLNQTHSTKVIELPYKSEEVISADASFTQQIKQVCVVMTADCLPILLTNTQGTQVAAVHAGWRALLDGILENCIECMQGKGMQGELIAWIGPAISQAHFEVGSEVREAFLDYDDALSGYFIASSIHAHKWYADLAAIAEYRMQQAQVAHIFRSNLCTYEGSKQFYSYRRDGQTGRQASLIWLE